MKIWMDADVGHCILEAVKVHVSELSHGLVSVHNQQLAQLLHISIDEHIRMGSSSKSV